MTKINLKDYAFPSKNESGLTKNEYFLGKALQGLMANSSFITPLDINDGKTFAKILFAAEDIVETFANSEQHIKPEFAFEL